MRLTKLEIYGFKSFAKRTEIIFPQNVTGIVGPNGSGKSNIGDAVRWVLGEQSARNLRGNSMQDVIFNGTEHRRPMNWCEVTLVFDNSDGQLPVSFGEVSITRRVYRSGESEYLMNGAACRLKDIVELFRDTGVGKEGYSLIGQGRIDEILSQRGEDRREVFEEAAGISRFRSRKEEAENRLKKAEENLTRVQDVLEELEKHLGPLQEQAESAREYVTLAENLKELDLRLYLVRYSRLEKKETAAQQILLTLTDGVNAAEKALEEAAAARERLEQEQESLQSALSAAHDGLLEQNEQLYQTREALTEITNRLENQQETLKRLAGEADSTGNKLRLLEATLRQSDGGLEEAKSIVEQAQEALTQRREKHETTVQKAETLEKALSQHNARVMERMNRIQTARTAQARQSAMQQAMKERRQEIAAQLEQEKENSQAVREQTDSARESLEKEQEKLEELRKGLAAFEERAQAALERTLSLEKQLHEEQQNLRAAQTRLHTLKELQQGLEGYQYAVKNALNQARKTEMKGVHGVLAMLLSVPEQYETALDMALGAGLQNIVTETEQEAKSLIDYLRANHLGRATFLPVSTVKSRTLTPKEREVLSMDGCIGVASELISFDEKYRGIVENLLGRTVVARDLDSGIPIMRKGNSAFRLVTLQGDLMHQGGSMTGGSTQQKASNLLGRDREINELSASVETMTKQIEQMEQELSEGEESRSREKTAREQAQYAFHQQEIAVARDTEHLEAARKNQSAQEETVNALEEALSQLDEGLSEISRQLEEAESAAMTETEDEAELNARTVELSAQLDLVRREREGTQEALTDAMLLLQNAQRDSETLTRDRKRLLSDAEGCRTELDNLSQKQSQIREGMEKDGLEKEKAAQAIEEKEKQVNRAKEQVSLAEGELKAKQEEIRQLQGEMEAQRKESQRESERLHRQEMALSRLHTEMTSLNDRIWTTYELTRSGAQEAVEAMPQQPNLTGNWQESFDEEQAEHSAGEIRERIKAMGTVNVSAIDEYGQMFERYTQLSAQRTDLSQAKADLEELIAQLLEKMEEVFVEQFALLRDYFSETFTRLFDGGSGEIQLSDPKDPLGCGIEIIVQPPGKKRQLLSLFSGGERALTAIAILFAMLKLKPTPFCILDEIEAALDDANISSFADYLKEFSRDTQFVVVTHRKGTMERCDNLFGVAMEEKGVSSLVSVNLTDYQ